MSYYCLNPHKSPLQISAADALLVPMAADEIVTDAVPATIETADDPRGQADLIEISGLICGAALGTVNDMTVSVYPCDEDGNADAEAVITYTLDISAVDVVGLDIITNGAFAADTDWTKGASWSIAAGKASHDATAGKTRLLQSVNVSQNVEYLLTVAAAVNLDVFLGDEYLGNLGANKAILHKRLAAASPAELQFVGLGDSVDLDDVAMKGQDVYRFHKLLESKSVGPWWKVGVLPAADATGSYLSLWQRRYKKMT